MKEPLVVHVNEQDQVLGYIPKMLAHRQGMLHRAVSVMIFNSDGDWLMQKRADEKYHSGGLWSNTCCSHPYPKEEVKAAATRRLEEEMGLNCPVEKVSVFTYSAKLDNNLIEHEVDHLFTGVCDDLPKLNPDEVSDWKFMTQSELEKEMETHPEHYTEWFKIIFPKIKKTLNLT